MMTQFAVGDASETPIKRPERRLTDKIRAAFHAACDDGEVEIATRLLERMEHVIDNPVAMPPGGNRRRPESLTAPCERLANLLLWRVESTGNARRHPPEE